MGTHVNLQKETHLSLGLGKMWQAYPEFQASKCCGKASHLNLSSSHPVQPEDEGLHTEPMLATSAILRECEMPRGMAGHIHIQEHISFAQNYF